MHFQTMSVTPELASIWLKKNDKNRNISAVHVKKLAHEMAHGGWVLNGQTVSFDDGGRLLDGQHRLSAVVMSGCTVPMAIAVGVSDPEAFKTYDATALKRGAHHVAQVMGVKNANKVSAAARVIMCWEAAQSPSQFASMLRTGMRELQPAEVAEKACELQEELIEAGSMINLRLSRASGAGTLVEAILVLLNRADPVGCASFTKKLNTGMFDSAEDPCLHLRDRIIAGRGSVSANAWRPTLAALMIKAFNYHRRGLPLKSLRWRQEGDNPESFPKIDGGGK